VKREIGGGGGGGGEYKLLSDKNHISDSRNIAEVNTWM
jgi:hypothetical protein